MKKAIGYIRVSTGKQAIDGVSLEAQEEKIRAWAVINDYEVEILSDAGVSGKRADNREALQQALNTVENGDALVVYSMSRLSRSQRDMLDIAEYLNKRGADLVSLSENIDTTSAAGKMVFGILAVMSEFERNQISERTKTALQYKKDKGERVGHVPFGMMLDDDGVNLVENKEETSIIKKIKKLYQQGKSVRVIAGLLNKDGLTNRGSAWTHSSVHRRLAASKA